METSSQVDKIVGPRGGKYRRHRVLVCKVCGDAASGVHFEVATCNGCQQFFRRTLLEARRYQCRWNNSCTLEKGNRCACRACRYKKCIEAGMNSSTMRVLPPGPDLIDLTETTGNPTPEQEPINETININSPSTSTSLCLSKELTDIQNVKKDDRQAASWAPYLEENTFQNVLSTLLNIEGNVERLRKIPEGSPMLFLDVLTRPSPFSEPMPTLEAVEICENPSIDMEIYCLLEYAKCFKWFSMLCFSDKCTILGERLPALLALRLAWNNGCQGSRLPYSLLLTPLMDLIKQVAVDRMTLSILSALLFTDTTNIHLSGPAQTDHLKQHVFYTSCLSTYLMHRYGTIKTEMTAKHLAILSACLRIGDPMRLYLKELEPENSLTHQIVEMVISRK